MNNKYINFEFSVDINIIYRDNLCSLKLLDYGSVAIARRSTYALDGSNPKLISAFLYAVISSTVASFKVSPTLISRECIHFMKKYE